MAKEKIDRRVFIKGHEVRVRASSEEEYAQKIMAHIKAAEALVVSPAKPRKHLFRTYAAYWFHTFSEKTSARATAITYERQLKLHLYPAFGEKAIEDITTADVQNMFNQMNGTKETKKKCKNVLNMIFELAIEEEILQKNPLHSRYLKITGASSKPTELYTLEQMRFLAAHIKQIRKPMDRMYLALQAFHPLRPEETLGLRWKDIDLVARKIHVNHAVTHPDRNQGLYKETKTEQSQRVLDLVEAVVQYLQPGEPDEFVVSGKQPISYTQLRKMCERIQADTGFTEKITPRRFRTTVLSDLYAATKDVKQVQEAAGHTTAAMTFKYYVKGRPESMDSATPIQEIYQMNQDPDLDSILDNPQSPQRLENTGFAACKNRNFGQKNGQNRFKKDEVTKNAGFHHEILQKRGV